MKVRHGIGCALLAVGILLCLGAVGELDFLTEQGALGSGDERIAYIRALIGVVLTTTAVVLNHDMEYEE